MAFDSLAISRASFWRSPRFRSLMSMRPPPVEAASWRSERDRASRKDGHAATIVVRGEPAFPASNAESAAHRALAGEDQVGAV